MYISIRAIRPRQSQTHRSNGDAARTKELLRGHYIVPQMRHSSPSGIANRNIADDWSSVSFAPLSMADNIRYMDNHITSLGTAYHRYGDRPFGIRRSDRLHHIYMIGQTGTGKSTLLSNMVLADAASGEGLCLIDPHGDLAGALHENLSVPHHYFDIASPDCEYGYNPLTPVARGYRPLVASGLIETLKKQWSDSWGARMEHLLRYALLALLDQPDADLRDIVRLYVDKEFRRTVVARIADEQVRAFWTVEFPNMNYMNAIDGVAPIANKIGAFLANPVVRRAVCEPKVPLRFRQIMDRGEILIANLAKGRLGTDMANVMGGLLVSTIMNAAFSRASIKSEERRPFMLYIDEFPSFTTEAFANLLPEARKYALSLHLVHQHVSQVDRSIFDAVLGNAGTVIAFRVGVQDATIIGRQLGDIAPADLTRLPNYHAYVQLMIDGSKSRAFSMQTWPPAIGGKDSDGPGGEAQRA